MSLTWRRLRGAVSVTSLAWRRRRDVVGVTSSLAWRRWRDVTVCGRACGRGALTSMWRAGGVAVLALQRPPDQQQCPLYRQPRRRRSKVCTRARNSRASTDGSLARPHARACVCVRVRVCLRVRLACSLRVRALPSFTECEKRRESMSLCTVLRRGKWRRWIRCVDVDYSRSSDFAHANVTVWNINGGLFYIRIERSYKKQGSIVCANPFPMYSPRVPFVWSKQLRNWGLRNEILFHSIITRSYVSEEQLACFDRSLFLKTDPQSWGFTAIHLPDSVKLVHVYCVPLRVSFCPSWRHLCRSVRSYYRST